MTEFLRRWHEMCRVPEGEWDAWAGVRWRIREALQTAGAPLPDPPSAEADRRCWTQWAQAGVLDTLRRMCAMGRTEGVVDVEIGQRRQRLGEIDQTRFVGNRK